MPRIQRAETDTYNDVWNGLDHYGDLAPGEQWADAFVLMTGTTMRGSVLDAGCGSGKGALALAARGFTVTLCDLTDAGLIDDARRLPFIDACLWSDLRRVCGFRDWVYCCDVMEHLPPEFTMLAIARMLGVARRGVFLSITFVPDHFGQILGKPLHQTVQPFTWWRDRLAELGEVIDARDCLQSGLFLVRPR